MTKHKIEFIEGEPFCRYDGILCDAAGCKSIYGYEDELSFIDETTIIMEDTLYTDNDLASVISSLAKYQGTSEDYDTLLNQGRGFASWAAHKEYDNSYILSETDMSYFEGVKQIKPFAEFAKDYPQINLEKYDEFMEALNKFYEELQTRSNA